MRELVDELCSDRCAGRATGSLGGRLARGIVVDALRAAGVDPAEQPIPRVDGANVLATIPGDLERYVLVAAHYDHLGRDGGAIYRGADDNAAAVAILVDVARALAADRPRGRGVIIAAFDAEEPPHFTNDTMGSLHFVRHPLVPLDRIDLMVCMELVGHSLGDARLPSEVQRTLFLLGAERSEGTREHVEELARSEPGLIVRPADAEVIPPLSDYLGFWDRQRPFVLLTGGRNRYYHTPQDVPAHLDFARMGATARWLERFVRDQCARGAEPFVFRNRRDDLTTLESIRALLLALAPASEIAAAGLGIADGLRARVLADRTLPDALRPDLAQLVAGIESGLA
ncbi:MAG: M28 family peptidase [Myxococcota bacterium]|nr:M28 family peptidase [Myxococcota bacterium]